MGDISSPFTSLGSLYKAMFRRVLLLALLLTALDAAAGAVEETPEEVMADFDANSDGFVTYDEIHSGVREKLFFGNEEAFQKHFAPNLDEFFPLSDSDSD